MKIKQLKINNFIGIKELDWNPGELNVIEGPKGTGKTSIIEAIEKTISNNNRRYKDDPLEVIRHGEDEATLFIRMDEGLEIDRKIRKNKSDYLKLTGKEVAKSTEGELRKFIRGDIFNPLDFVNLDSKKQTEIILSMIRMDYSKEEINNWFGEDVLSGINTQLHMLQILKDIESKYYKERQENNRKIRSLESVVSEIERELPDNYQGEKWKNESVQEYYDRVKKARDLNELIDKAQALKDGFEDRIAKIKAEHGVDAAEIESKYLEEERRIRELIIIRNDNIEEKEKEIEEKKIEVKNRKNNIDRNLEKKIEKLKEYAEEQKRGIEKAANNAIEEIKSEQKELEKEISAKEESLKGLDSKKELEIESLDKELKQKLEAEKEKLGKAGELLEEKEKKEVEPLQEEADHVAKMKEYLSEWNRMVDIRDGKLAKLKDYSDHLTNLIEIAREKPVELLKLHKSPIEGISIDGEGRIRIGQTLLDGLSDGEQLEVAFKIALERMGRLRIMCINNIQYLNKSERQKVYDFCKENDIQLFVVVTEDGEKVELKTKEEDNEQTNDN